MKTEDLLRELNRIKYCGDFETAKYIMNDLIEKTKKDLLAEATKSMGKTKIISAIKRFLKDSVSQIKSNERLYMKAFTEENIQYITNGYGVIMLNNPLPLPEAEDRQLLSTCKKCIDAAKNNMIENSLPDNTRLKAEIKIRQANLTKEQKKEFRVSYDIGEEQPCINAEWLTLIMDLFPDCKTVKTSSFNNIGAAYFESQAGKAVILPIKYEDKNSSLVINFKNLN